MPILNDYASDKLDNQHLLCLRLQMSHYAFTTKWIPGKLNIEADALSRSLVSHGSVTDELEEGPSAFTARTAVVGIMTGSAETAIELALKKVKRAVASDPVKLADGPSPLLGRPSSFRHRRGRRHDCIGRPRSHPKGTSPRDHSNLMRDVSRSVEDASTCSTLGIFATHGRGYRQACSLRNMSGRGGRQTVVVGRVMRDNQKLA
ncbi:Uncharacterized protein APZ42_030343 [Daphnia magna]|uniref:Uncharacterized protein n=1 Tax=Daphnia magna TaxID=35525 RepID=A0A164NUM9_9CRUS|nr:Uncharacterized protein APZ42_030343 [Daphnia magna]